MNNMKRMVAYLLAGVITLLGLSSFSSSALGAENQADFSVNAEQSAYQIDKSKTYFDLSLPVKETVPLVIHVTNNSDKAIEVAGELSPATTNLNGVVEYGKTQNKLTTNVPFDITQIASFEKRKQTIEAKQTRDFVVNVTAPTKEYAGIVAGGITFRDVTEDQASNNEKGMFKNKFAYAIALLIHGDKPAVKNNITLKEVVPTQVNSRNVVSAAIENEAANYINKVSIEASVIDHKGKEILKENKEDMQIAPDSIFQFPIYYGQQEMKSGKYTLTMTVKSEKEEWKLKKDFNISSNQASELKKTDVSEKEGKSDIQWLIFVLLGIIFLLVITFIIVLKKKR